MSRAMERVKGAFESWWMRPVFYAALLGTLWIGSRYFETRQESDARWGAHDTVYELEMHPLRPLPERVSRLEEKRLGQEAINAKREGQVEQLQNQVTDLQREIVRMGAVMDHVKANTDDIKQHLDGYDGR